MVFRVVLGRLQIRWFVVALVVLLAVPASAGAATGPMKIHYYQRPGSACASTNPTAAGAKKYTSAVSQTGLAFDGSELLVSCWGDGSILKVSEAGSVLGQLQVTGVAGLGGISWDADHNVLWACAITGTNKSLSNQIGWVEFDPLTQSGAWHYVGNTPHGCTNNLNYANGVLWADGAYKLSHGTSQWIDAGTAVLDPPLKMTATYRPFTPDGHVSGAIPGADGLPLWEADNWTPTTKSIWEAGATSPIETGTQRFEQLVCDPNAPTGPMLFVKWFNQNGFGAIPVDRC